MCVILIHLFRIYYTYFSTFSSSFAKKIEFQKEKLIFKILRLELQDAYAQQKMLSETLYLNIIIPLSAFYLSTTLVYFLIHKKKEVTTFLKKNPYVLTKKLLICLTRRINIT